MADTKTGETFLDTGSSSSSSSAPCEEPPVRDDRTPQEEERPVVAEDTSETPIMVIDRALRPVQWRVVTSKNLTYFKELEEREKAKLWQKFLKYGGEHESYHPHEWTTGELVAIARFLGPTHYNIQCWETAFKDLIREQQIEDDIDSYERLKYGEHQPCILVIDPDLTVYVGVTLSSYRMCRFIKAMHRLNSCQDKVNRLAHITNEIQVMLNQIGLAFDCKYTLLFKVGEKLSFSEKDWRDCTLFRTPPGFMAVHHYHRRPEKGLEVLTDVYEIMRMGVVIPVDHWKFSGFYPTLGQTVVLFP